jgi:hypothetical protein
MAWIRFVDSGGFLPEYGSGILLLVRRILVVLAPMWRKGEAIHFVEEPLSIPVKMVARITLNRALNREAVQAHLCRASRKDARSLLDDAVGRKASRLR